MQKLTAVYDSCVFYPAPIRDLLLEIVEEELVNGVWTEKIQEEWVYNLLKNRTDLKPDHLQETKRKINTIFGDCIIKNYENLIPCLNLPDLNDRHVLAAAIKSQANLIVTCNLKDFPTYILNEFNLKAQHPDIFLRYIAETYSEKFLFLVKKIKKNLKKPPITTEKYLNNLSNLHLYKTVEFLKFYKDII